MIVKKGNKWLVKDSSGSKILGTHDSKESATKQLAAIEISKKEKSMKNEEHELKLKCARLNEIRKQLIAELKLINEELAAQSMSSSVPNQPQNKQSISEKSKPSPKQAIESPIKAQQGLLYTGVAAKAQEDLLKNYTDNKETAEVEEAKDASWQSVNNAIGNYMTQQVQKLAQSQQMGQ